MKKIELNEMKKIELDALKFIDYICTKNEIKYSLIGGSLIGAIRHNGFIPWDDDIDIGMTLENYLKFEKAVNGEVNSNYILMSYKTNPEYYYPFNKLIDKRTILHEEGLKDIKDYGIFIDIFIYSGISDNIKEREKHYKKIKKIQSLLTIYAMTDIKEKSFFMTVSKKVIKKVVEKIGIGRLIKYSYKLSNKYDSNTTKYIISNWPIYKIEKELKTSTMFDELEYHKFEDTQAQIVKRYEEFLKGTFGDYMKLPPEEDRFPKHGLKAYWR